MPMTDKLEQVSDLDLRGGSRVKDGGVAFALYSRHATKVELCLFDDNGDVETARLALYRHEDHIWRGFLRGAGAGVKYGYRVDGPFEPENGHWFNPAKLLVDPFARELFGQVQNDPALFAYAQQDGDGSAFDTTDSAPFVPKSVVTSEMPDALGDHLRTPYSDSIIYELHVAGYSKLHGDLPESLRGTFEGLTSEPLLRHMKDLGITAVELLPIYPFNDEPHLWHHGLSNYWGYNPYNFFAPDPRFGNREQFRAMVQRFHEAGIEVLLDIVYNHTGEGDAKGPTLSLRGIDNASYYRHLRDQPGTYVNDTGCGNTLDLENDYVREMVLSSLRYWATELGVDGFRFDLAPVLARSREGFSGEAPFFKSVASDPVLSRLKLIAEPWDIGPGGYQLGEFPLGWSEWNDKYRDTVRAFWRGDDSVMGELAGRMSGSKELFLAKGRRPQAGINFITAHDGFTLQDLVSFEHKHNDANLEGNRDGHSHNISRNYGVEGISDDADINALRNRQKRNMLATMFLSQGVPMLQAGDELGRSQGGNNNSYCQNNELSWIDWQNADLELAGFVARLIELRRNFPQLRLHGFLSGEPGSKGDVSDVTWLSPQGQPMQNSDWELPYARCFGFHLAGLDGEKEKGQPLLVLFNAHHEAIDFKMPSTRFGSNWQCMLETNGVPDHQMALEAKEGLALAAHSFMIFAGQASEAGEVAEGDLYSLSELCEIAGIDEAYSDLSGQTHHLSDEAKHQLLRVMHDDAFGPENIDQQVRDHIERDWQTLMPGVVVLRQSLHGKVEQGAHIRISEDLMGLELEWSLELESGRSIKGVQNTEHLPLINSRRIGNQLIHELALDPPHQLPPGYHQLDLKIGERQASVRLIIAPAHCYRPPWMENHQRLFGIAHQLYSLGTNREKGIGDFSDLGDLALAAGQSGADVLGVSPTHALFPDQPERASPYSPSSRMALNVLFLDVRKMDGFDDCPDLQTVVGTDEKLVDYTHVASTKNRQFDQLYAHFMRSGTSDQKRDFARFCFERGDNLRAFATFSALGEHFDGKSTDQWPQAFRDPRSKEVQAFVADNEMRIYFFCWLQWQAERQLARAADICAEQGMKVGLYGDLAVGVAADGAECWANASNYLHGISFGAPPDAFNARGQNWCMPPFDPAALRETAYQPFIDILRENMRHCGALRMDHVMWLQRMFVIPLDEPASSGAYVRFPLDDLLAVLALESSRAKCIVIGEDLGTVPLGFRERMQRENILSYRLMRFEKQHDGNFKAPCDYPYLALSTPSSHDLPTIRGFIRGDDLKLLQKIGLIETEEQLKHALAGRDHELQQLINALRSQGLLALELFDDFDNDHMLDELAAAISLYLARAGSALTMVNLEDLAGSLEQVNVPGTVFEVPNWRHRLGFDPSVLLDDEHLRRLFDLIAIERSDEFHADKKSA